MHADTDLDKIINEFIDRKIKQFSGVKQIKAGVIENATYDDGTKVSEVALKNEYGSENTPPRSFLRTTEKNKLAGIANGAQANVIETIAVNGSNLTPTSKKVDITVPTAVSDLTNDSGYQTASQVTSAINSAIEDRPTESEMTSAIQEATDGLATETYVTQQLANINKKQVVTSTVQMTDANTIYLMANDSDEPNNIYDEYIVVSGKPEKIGTTEVDLTNYVQESELVAISNHEIDTMMAS